MCGLASLLLASLGALPISSAAGPDPKTILKGIAGAYQRLLDYRVTVETKVESTGGGSPPTKCRYDLAASRPRMMFTQERVLLPIVYEVRLGTDGKTAWGYSPTRKQYELDAVGNGGAALTAALRNQHRRLFTRFEVLDRLDVTVSIDGRGTIRAGGRAIPCIRLRLRPTPAGRWTEWLWVDPVHYMVWKSVFREQRVLEVVTTTTTWKTITVDRAVNPEVFGFVPPENATQTNQLSVP